MTAMTATSTSPGSTSNGLALHITSAAYGQTQVLHELRMHVNTSEIVGLFGHNGAGKSTMLRVVAGLHRRASYEAQLNGASIKGKSPHSIARSGLVLVREGAKVFEGLTVAEHLDLGARLGRQSGRGAMPHDDIYDRIPILGEFRKRPASQLSGGQRQLLAIGMAVIANPACLLLDEPSTGLSPMAIKSVRDVLVSFVDKGVMMLVAEQSPAWLLSIVQRAYLLELGRVIGEGPPETLLGVTDTDQAKHLASIDDHLNPGE